jgi:endonuclease G, mitochondrial
MLTRLILLLFLFVPVSVQAETAPEGCTDHFIGSQMPNVSPNRTEKSRLLCFSGYAVLHSGLSKTPIWSAEHLTSERMEDAGKVTRKNSFHPEQKLQPDERAELDDYKGSGFDRGHMSPSGDMPSKKAMRESFSLANMIPQHPCNNEELWEGIESAVRQLATDEDEVYTVTGPVYPKTGQIQQIGEGVLVPTHVFKAVYIPSRNGAAAYVTPNTDGKDFKVISISDLKKLVDVDVFPTLKAKVKSTPATLPPPMEPKFRCRLHTE